MTSTRRKEIKLQPVSKTADYVGAVHIESGAGMRNIQDADKVVLRRTRAFLHINYPLTQEAVRFITCKGRGFTRASLISQIRKEYKKVYKEENASTKAPVRNIPGMLNRDFTDGVHGIWGHDIGDLVLSGIQYQIKNKELHIYIGVDS